MSESPIRRREFLGRSLLGLVVLSGAAPLVACGGSSGPDCANPSGLDATQQGMRRQLAYVDRATDPNKQCQKCQMFEGGASAEVCGTCTMNLGPVSPLGTCTGFVAKT